MNTFTDYYTDSPAVIQDFLYSRDFFEFLDDAIEKFEINESEEVDFIGLLQDISIKFFEPDNVNSLTIEIVKRLNFEHEKSSQIAHYIWTRFKPIVDKIWKNSEIAEKEKEESKEEQIKDIISSIKTNAISKNVVDIGKVAQKQIPVPISNFQFPISKQIPKIPKNKPVNLNIEPVNPKIIKIPDIKKFPNIQLIPDTELTSGENNKSQGNFGEDNELKIASNENDKNDKSNIKNNGKIEDYELEIKKNNDEIKNSKNTGKDTESNTLDFSGI